MKENNFIYGILYAIGAFTYYKFYRWWLNGREKNEAFFKPLTKVYILKDWFLIITLIIMSLVYFIRFIKNVNL